MVFKNKIFKQKKNIYLNNNKTTLYNTLFVIDEILNDDFGRDIVDFANYCVLHNIGVVIFTKFISIKLLLNEKIILFENNSCNSSNLLFSKNVLKLCNEYKIDIIQIFNPKFCKKIILKKSKIKVPVVAQVYNVFDIRKRWNFFYLKYVVKSDMIITLSDYVADFLLNNFDFDVNKLKVFNIGVDNELFNAEKIASGRVKDTMIYETGIDVSKKKIFYCNCDFNDTEICYKIFQAIKLINNDNYVFIFSGNFENTKKQRDYLLKKIDELKINNKVKIIKPINDRPAIYISSYVIINIQKYNNTFTKSFCEAGFMKKPIIEICNGNLYSNVVDEKTGFLVKKNSIFDIKNAISKMIDLTPKEYKSMCENSYKYTIKYFKMDEKYMQISNAIFECLQQSRNKHQYESKNDKNKKKFLV